jgi:hypothetical protein
VSKYLSVKILTETPDSFNGAERDPVYSAVLCEKRSLAWDKARTLETHILATLATAPTEAQARRQGAEALRAWARALELNDARIAS